MSKVTTYNKPATGVKSFQTVTLAGITEKSAVSRDAASDTSAAGTASMTSTTLTFVDGVATAELAGDAADWLDTETATTTITQQTS